MPAPQPPPDDTVPLPTLIDYTAEIAALAECTGRAMTLIRRTEARALAAADALPDAAARRGPDPVLEFSRLARTLTRVIALKARLMHDQHTQIDSIAAERARREARSAQRRNAASRQQIARAVDASIDTATARGHGPSLSSCAGCLDPVRLDDMLATHSVAAIIARICRDLGIPAPDNPPIAPPVAVEPPVAAPPPAPSPPASRPFTPIMPRPAPPRIPPPPPVQPPSCGPPPDRPFAVNFSR